MADQTASQIVTRFAPSPTGLLHVGGARTALFSWAYARGRSGQFLLRLEDTDQKRSSDAAADAIIEDLRWLGLDWDNDTIPRQSERLDRYREIIGQLKDQGIAYEDDGAVRFKMQNSVSFSDATYGPITIEQTQLEDFVIQKTDGFPTFHLAVVVDDHDFGVTHIIRGQEHLSNTPKHAAIYDALGWDRPTWCHMPNTMNPDGSKMSKRDKAKAARKAAKEANDFVCDSIDSNRLSEFMTGDNDELDIAEAIGQALGLHLPEINVADFRDSGYLPGVLCNYLALLGWNPGNDVERFDLDFLKEHFDIARVNKANSKFDRIKLASFNGDTLQNMPPEEFASLLCEHFAKHHTAMLNKLGDNFRGFASMYQPRSKTLNDPAEQGAFFFTAPSQYDAKAVKKNLHKNEGEGLNVLRGFREELAGLESWEPQTIHGKIESYTTEKQLKNMGSVAQPLRVAMSGTAVTPPIDQALALLGREETLSRIARCLEQCAS